jgi:two-component sensor histidine kinase
MRPRPAQFWPWLVPAAIVISIGGALVLTRQMHEAYERRAVTLKTELTAQQVARRLDDYMRDRLHLLYLLRDDWVDGRFTSRERYQERATQAARLYRGIMALNWIDAAGVIIWVAPPEENQAAQGRDLTAHPVAGPVLVAARDTGTLRVTPPLTLYQGGVGVASYLPVTSGAELLGFVNGAFRLEPLIEAAFAEDFAGIFYHRIVDQDGGIVAERWPAEDGLASAQVVRELGVGDRTWRLHLTPAPGLITRSDTWLDEVVSVIGMTLALGLGGVTWWLLRSREQLRHSQERLQALAENVPGVFYSYEVRGGERTLIYMGPGLEHLLGPENAAAVRRRFDGIFDLVHPEDRALLSERVAQIPAGGGEADCELRMAIGDGAYRWIRSLGRAVPRGPGRTRWHVVLIDISEQRRLLERQRLMMNELDHRVRNNLAAVLALADQTHAATNSLPAFRRAFEGRVMTMARTHEALARQQWRGALLSEVVEMACAPFRLRPDRLVLRGGRIVVGAEGATALALVLNELATNALKHGAWSEVAGRVEVSWEESDGLELSWVEHEGPAPAAAPVEGCGTRLIRGLVERELAGRAEVRFAAGGVRWRIRLPRADAPAAHLEAKPGEPAAL